jgi:dTDP-4-dehydrorhamnose 3,5-epimerase
MNFHATAVEGAYVVEPERLADERGFFARTFDSEAFRTHGLDPVITQSSISFNRQKATLRGLHYQVAPYEEAKLVRCVRGAVFDVAVDLRPTSPTYLINCAVELTAENRLALYVPAGCAHGYLTLEDSTELEYGISQAYEPAATAGVRWDDPLFGIVWPETPHVISPQDASYPDYRRITEHA